MIRMPFDITSNNDATPSIFFLFTRRYTSLILLYIFLKSFLMADKRSESSFVYDIIADRANFNLVRLACGLLSVKS